MKVVFRADASEEQGGGHVMRSLVIANEFAKRGHECFFVSLSGSFDMVPFRENSSVRSLLHKIEIENKHVDDCNHLKSLLPSGLIPDLVLVDSYLLQEDYEIGLSKICSKVAALDDVPNRHHSADILIDPTFQRKSREYANFMRENTVVLAGVDYAPLREEFARLRSSSLTNRLQRIQTSTQKNVVISMGLSDPDNITLKILSALENVKTAFNATVVIGNNSLREQEILALSKSLKFPISVLIAHEDMAHLFFESDLAVGAGGSSSWERCCLGLPTVQVTLALNQQAVTSNLASVGAIYDLGTVSHLKPEVIAKEIDRLLTDSKYLMKMSRAAFQVCDGLGAMRIVEHLEKLNVV
ncbi:MAG: UDP-2,4-diacetamido-2,4,6-trideoxy-beta-L-altropyranose hydrolase [Cyanobacteria bacterium TGS_CYA1]|nr:UDP-2,4-diacetamido-2,4,6-trideoxy-beta-L-altropyranose hydrolase [Cyanobacteria bacterium TGS_CYA1]